MKLFTRAALSIAFGSVFFGCSTNDPEVAPFAKVTEAVTNFCYGHIGAPCDPDGTGPLKECDGICIASGFSSVCVKSTTSGENNGKVCGKTYNQKSDCNQTCVGSDCVSGAKAPDGTACKPDDGYVNYLCAGQCKSGACAPLLTTEVCAASTTACSVKTCDAKKATSCITVAQPAGTACNDGNDCTTGDKCDSAGACAGSTAPLGTACYKQCYNYGTLPDGGLTYINGKCDSAGACTASTSPLAAGSYCTVPGSDTTCNPASCNGSGTCVKTVKCPASTDPCKAVACDISSGGCIVSYTTAACVYDKCFAGVCASGTCGKGSPSVDCDDKDPCTTDTCDGTTGACGHTVISGCVPDTGPADTGPADTGTGTDSGTAVDSGTTTDTGATVDTGSATDTGGAVDTGSATDTGTAADTGTAPKDSGAAADGSATDAGDDAAVDADPVVIGGCGCRTVPATDLRYAGFAVLGAALALARRRRRD